MRDPTIRDRHSWSRDERRAWLIQRLVQSIVDAALVAGAAAGTGDKDEACQRLSRLLILRGRLLYALGADRKTVERAQLSASAAADQTFAAIRDIEDLDSRT